MALGNELLTAIRVVDVATVQGLIKSNQEKVIILLNYPEEENLYFLHEACKVGSEDIVNVLIAYYETTNLNQPSPEGTPLSLACESGYYGIVDSLLINGVSVPGPEPGDERCVFYLAAVHGWDEILELLIEKRSDLKDDPGLSQHCLDAAVVGGHLVLVKVWFNKFRRLHNSHDTYELMPKLLAKACEKKHCNVIEFLRSSGAQFSEDITERYAETIGDVLRAQVFPWKGDEEEEEDGDPGQEKRESSIGGLVMRWSSKSLYSLRLDWLLPFVDVIGWLNLAGNHLTTLPPEVPWIFTNLIKFSVSRNNLLSLSSPDAEQMRCKRLKSINLSFNNLEKVPPEIFHLESLRRLDLSHNKLQTLVQFQPNYKGNLSPDKFMSLGPGLSSDHSHEPIRIHNQGPRSPMKMSRIIEYDQIWSCVNLDLLDVSYNNLQELPPQLQMCGQLGCLRAAHNQLKHFLPPWTCPLELLDLSENSLDELPDGMSPTWDHYLTKLYLHHNKLDTIPQTVCALRNLQVLDFSHNNVEKLPEPSWWKCGHLEELNLAHNDLTHGPCNCFLRGITRLRITETTIVFPHLWQDTLAELDLSHNDLREVPPSVCQLRNLKQLNLNFNPELQTLPAELGHLQECFELGLRGTHISNIPRELIHSSPIRTRAILAHLKYRLRSAKPYNNMKLLVVGKENTGKTSLTALLRGKPLPEEDQSTNTVIIHDWHVLSSAIKRKIQSKMMKREEIPDVTFQVWDFAGQDNFYGPHKLFLSPASLYLIVFDLRLHREGVEGLKPWLLDIEAHAPRSLVILVGTFLDYLNREGRSRLDEVRASIRAMYQPSGGFPIIDQIVMVSCSTKENIDVLQEVLYATALGMDYRGLTGKKSTFLKMNITEEKIIGRKVPKSYIDLGKVLKIESYSRRRNNKLPILNTQEILDLATHIPENDIHTTEELELAINFLHEAGYLLHYSSTLRRLNELHFTDPLWLADCLSKLITVDMSQRCIKDGLMDLGVAQSILFTEETHKMAGLGQYVDLLEKFEIALLLDSQRLLVPSKLQNIRPSSVDEAQTTPGYSALYRMYHMKCIPSGFWPRLIIQFVTMLQRVCREIIFPIELAGNYEDSRRGEDDREWDRMRISYGSLPLATRPVRVTYWQEGIALDFKEGLIIVEDFNQILNERRDPQSGVIITVATEKKRNFSTMGFAVDQLEALINQWFPGLVDDSNPIDRLIPCPGCVDLFQSISACQNLYMFSVQECASKYLANEHVKFKCPRCKISDIHPEDLIPDFTLSDLPHYLHLKIDEVQFDKSRDVLGSGGEGIVYRGTFGSEQVAFKQSSVVQSIRSCRDQIMEVGDAESRRQARDILPWELQESSELDDEGASMAGHLTLDSAMTTSSLDSVKWLIQFKLLPAFQDFRKEVALLSTLDHPCVISILGVMPPHLSYIMELAPMGSLNDVLDRALKEKLAKNPRHCREQTMLLERLSTCKIVYQIASGLQYLHKRKVVYKDLKPRNILVWSLDPEVPINVRLSDYGLSSYLTPQGVKGCEGTLGYQAPEMRKGSSYNEKVDIFALGMVIYQLFTGMQLFANVPSVVIPKQIDSGKRPSLKDENIRPDVPKLVMLMESCWSTDPGLRPVSAEVAEQIRNPSFWMLKEYPDRDLPKVSCIYLDLADEDRALMVYSIGRKQEICTPIKTDDVPLGIVYRDAQDPNRYEDAYVKELFVSFANGSIAKYLLRMTSKTAAVVELVQQQRHLSTENHYSVGCMMLMNNGQYLWAGHGSDIVILELDTMTVIDEIKCFESNKPLHLVRHMCCHDDQVWCFHRGCYEVFEIDVKTRIKFCKFDCSLGSSAGVSTVEWCHGSSTIPMSVNCNSSQSADNDVPPTPAKEAKGLKRISQSRMTLRLKSNEGNEEPTPRRRQTLPSSVSSSFQRKRSLCVHSMRRSAADRDAQSRKRHREAQYQIRSVCYTNGALWVGRKSGDILIINVTQSNPCDYKYGQVIAVICNEYLNGSGNGSVDHLVLSADTVTAIRTVKRELAGRKQAPQMSEVVVWEAMNIEDIHKTQQYWNINTK